MYQVEENIVPQPQGYNPLVPLPAYYNPPITTYETQHQLYPLVIVTCPTPDIMQAETVQLSTHHEITP